MAKNEKTSAKAASKASKALQDSTFFKSTKSVAGSDLTQTLKKGSASFPVKSFPIKGSSLTKAERSLAVRLVAASSLLSTRTRKK